MNGVSGKTIGLLGLSFKPNTDDLRDSPAMSIAEHLLKEGCAVRAYDPEALDAATQTLPDLTPCQDAYDAAHNVDAIVLATEWNEFRYLDFTRLATTVNIPIFIDLRNVYDTERMADSGFQYISVGRPPVGMITEFHQRPHDSLTSKESPDKPDDTFT